MANRYCFETLDRSLKDILSEDDQSNVEKMFGENMRLKKNDSSTADLDEMSAFDRWLLRIGEGTCVLEDESLLQIPDDLNLTEDCTPQETILNAVFPEVAIGREEILLSDTTCKAGGMSNDDYILYPTEFLITLICSGMSKHELQLTIGVPIMLLRNLNQADGLCNGTRLIVTHLGNRFIQAETITGSNIGHNVVIPRIVLSNVDTKWPFRLKRRQLPIAVGFCMTINKSQGRSLKTVGLYMKHHVFTHGQLYVVVWRVTSREGIKILLVQKEEETEDKLKLFLKKCSTKYKVRYIADSVIVQKLPYQN
ncbi:uncharacterized protein LOC116121129 [Pistacia vera]|uniref:uncharacterized protein LOC116121129 n=1 Tax=Pistacia vera TaxID=55513 RepID=UPI0012632AB3|nr:uncharacterized protein LOC116121129 [Pistacia vera]